MMSLIGYITRIAISQATFSAPDELLNPQVHAFGKNFADNETFVINQVCVMGITHYFLM